MNEVIAKLYEIEETADNILSNAKRVRDNLESQQKLEERAYAKEQQRELERRLERRAEELQQQAESQIAAMQEDYRKQMQHLDMVYDGHLPKLADEIVERMTEV